VYLLRKIAFPFSLLYGLVTSFRNYLFRTGILTSTQFKTPTIVVGNLSVGGTGKTPQIEYLIRLLQNDFRVAVLSRGYKRKTKGFIIAENNITSEDIGDEPFQYYKKYPNIIVCVDADRTNGIQRLEALEYPPQVILLDDAFQHRKVKAGLNILLTSYNDLYVNDSMLPTGNLREYKSGAKRAQIIVVTKCPANISIKEQQFVIEKLQPTSNQEVFFTTIEYDTKLKGDSFINLDDYKNEEVLLVTGIANPTPLLKYLTTKKIKFEHLKYPDHYHFSAADIKKIKQEFEKIKSNKKIVLTTEKDYVRIFAKLQNLRFISIQTKFVSKNTSFDKIIKNYVEQSSRDR
jgi:tetraacyldisaccharide 4'-kinase